MMTSSTRLDSFFFYDPFNAQCKALGRARTMVAVKEMRRGAVSAPFFFFLCCWNDVDVVFISLEKGAKNEAWSTYVSFSQLRTKFFYFFHFISCHYIFTPKWKTTTKTTKNRLEREWDDDKGQLFPIVRWDCYFASSSPPTASKKK